MKKYSFFILFVQCLAFCIVHAEQNQPWDSGRYIRVQEIQMDMPAYCLSVIKGDKIDKFELKILSIIKNARPGRDMILVVSTDERLKDAGAVHGFSGSPVYIDGKLAGAMSAGWDGALEPLYLVTPIEYMLTLGLTGRANDSHRPDSGGFNCIDTTQPLDLDEIRKKAEFVLTQAPGVPGKLPLATNLSAQACKAIAPTLDAIGLVPLAGGPAAGTSENTAIEPGGVLTVPLCSGDIRMAVSGTATEVVGDNVYGFGHAFTGSGAVELPMAAGTVHTLVATRNASFKLASPGDIAGTLRLDHNNGVAGCIGQKPPLIDLDIQIRRFDDPQPRTYRCKLARHRLLTPLILRSAIVGAALNQGELPPEHDVRYQCGYRLTSGQRLEFGNFSSQESIQEPAMNLFALTAALMNNPFCPLAPQAITLQIDIGPNNRVAALWETRLSASTVRPGETLNVSIRAKEFRGGLRDIAVDFPIPADCPQGRYALQISGVEGYQNFLTKNAPQRFVVTDAKSLLEGLNQVLNISSDRIYVCMTTSQSGIAIRNAELADLPQTKTALLTDSKRMQPIMPYQNFIEISVASDFVLSGAAAMDVVVEKNP